MQLFFSVGEPSGDHHAAELIHALQDRCPGINCTGYGGPLMREAGAHIDFELTNMSVMGIGAVIPLLGKFTKLYRDTVRHLRNRRPDAVVLVDFPGFNWWVAKAAWRNGIPVIYYMPPQLWAWAPWRIRKVRKFVDLVLSPLPFEAEWYRSRGVDTRYVGHPFLDEAGALSIDPSDHAFNSSQGRRVVILPGSRTQEVTRNFPVMLRVMQKLAARYADIHFHVACHKSAHRRMCESMLNQMYALLPITLHVGRTPEAISVCDMALMVSGSVSLELLKHAKPAVVLYKCGWATGAIGSIVTQCEYITLPNLIAGREVMPEFVFVGRDDVHINRMSRILSGWLESPEKLAEVRDELLELRDTLRQPQSGSATECAADKLIEILQIRDQQSRHLTSDATAVGLRAA